MTAFGKFVLVLCVCVWHATMEIHSADEALQLKRKRNSEKAFETPKEMSFEKLSSYKFGRCQYKVGVKDFDPSKLLGTWYEHYRLLNPYEMHAMCTVNILAQTSDEDFKATSYSMDAVTGEIWIVPTDLWRSKYDNSTLVGKFPAGSGLYGAVFPLQIIGTDYSNWFTAYSCVEKNQGRFHEEFVWIKGRNEIMEEEHINAAKAAANVQGIDASQLLRSKFDLCPPGYDTPDEQEM